LCTKELADFLALSRISLPYILPNLLNGVQTCKTIAFQNDLAFFQEQPSFP
jgi:hypothetical protein